MSKQNDIEGKESSKRYWAKILIRSGLIMTWILFILSCSIALLSYYKTGAYQQIPTDLIYLQLLTGLGALGFTLGERFNRK